MKKQLELFAGEGLESKMNEKYDNFLKDAGTIGRHEYGRMRRTLVKHFTRFSEEGRQPLSRYGNSKIYTIFTNVETYANRYVRRSKDERNK